MTDAQAREWLSLLVAEEHGHVEQHHDATGRHALRRDALTHALVALSDREALVEAVTRLYECKSEVAGEPAIWWADNEAQRVTGDAFDAAHHHMSGKK